MFNRIAEFHRAFGHPIAATPCFPDSTVRCLRMALLTEEVVEFCTAFTDQDRVEMADGLADVAVIIAGTMVAYGIVPGDGNFDSPYEDGSEPLLDAKEHHTFPHILRNGLGRYIAAEHGDDLDEVKHALMNMLMDVCGIAMNLRIPLNAVFAEVHRSNMSKLMPDGSVRYRSDGKILKPDNWSPPDIARVLNEADQPAALPFDNDTPSL